MNESAAKKTSGEQAGTADRLEALLAKTANSHITFAESGLFVRCLIDLHVARLDALSKNHKFSEKLHKGASDEAVRLFKEAAHDLYVNIKHWDAPLLGAVGPIADRAVYRKICSALPQECRAELPKEEDAASLENALSARNMAVRLGLKQLTEPLSQLISTVEKKAAKFQDVIRPGRFALQDGLPVTLGSVFASYAHALRRSRQKLQQALEEPVVIYGTGEDADFTETVRSSLEKTLRCKVEADTQPLAASFAGDSLLMKHAALQVLCSQIWKIARDLRLLCSGPRGGLGEITMPAVAPGSSIMPGKMNPVIAEMVYNTVDAVDANQTGIAAAMKSGWLESGVLSNVPVRLFLQSCSLLARTLPIFCDKCLAGITAQREQCAELAEKSLALRLCVRKTLGEEAAERVRSRAEKEGISVSEALVLEGLMTKDGAEKIPDAAELSGCVRRAAGCTEKCGGKA